MGASVGKPPSRNSPTSVGSPFRPALGTTRSERLDRLMHIPVVIIGAGPAGLLLSQVLARAGIDNMLLERRARGHVEGRIRAGVLEKITVDLLERCGAADRLHREGLVHDGFNLSLNGELFRIDIRELTGLAVTVYGQTELTKDLISAVLAREGRIEWEARDV